MSISDEVRKTLEETSPYRLAYYERTLNRIASEVAGNAKFHAERTAALLEEIDGVRNEVAALKARIDKMAEFLTQLKKEKNGK